MSPKRFRWGLLAAFVLQAALLTWMVVDRAMLLAGGEEIRLSVVPIDPRDFLRGDYVVLSYEISRLNGAKLDGDTEFESGNTIYVKVEPKGAEWCAVAIFRQEPSDGIALRGTVERSIVDDACSGNDCREFMVDYGLERFFVPEGAGRELERLRNDQRISVDVAVASNGRSALKRLLVDGEVRYEESLY